MALAGRVNGGRRRLVARGKKAAPPGLQEDRAWTVMSGAVVAGGSYTPEPTFGYVPLRLVLK